MVDTRVLEALAQEACWFESSPEYQRLTILKPNITDLSYTAFLY